jgi:hypothetical protein
LLRRGAGRIEGYGDGHRGIPTKALAEAAFAHASRIEEAERSGQSIPSLEYPKI